jgi:hypothetical protein
MGINKLVLVLHSLEAACSMRMTMMFDDDVLAMILANRQWLPAAFPFHGSSFACCRLQHHPHPQRGRSCHELTMTHHHHHHHHPSVIEQRVVSRNLSLL